MPDNLTKEQRHKNMSAIKGKKIPLVSWFSLSKEC